MLLSRSTAPTIFRRGLFATTAVLGVAVLGGVADADIMFDPGNDPQPGEENIQFESMLSGQTMFNGDTNANPTTQIEFNLIGGLSFGGHSYGETGIGTDGIGQADIVCTNNCGTYAHGGANGMQLQDLEIKLPTGIGAHDFIGNLDFGEGTAKIVVTDQAGAIFSYLLGNGQNYFTLTATNNEVITDIQITEDAPDANGNFGWNDFKQPRVSGLCTLTSSGSCTLIPVPEPSSLALLGAGIFAAGWFTTRRKSRNLAMTA